MNHLFPATCFDDRQTKGLAAGRAGVTLRAFSLVEILVVLALLSLIVVGLLAMFSQTQRAFRAGLTQTDYLEAGRMAAEMTIREFEQVAPSHEPKFGAFPYLGSAMNFYVYLPNLAPLYQTLPGSTEVRTNLLEDVFFIRKQNQEWIGVGYFVRATNAATGRLDPPYFTVNGKDTASVGTLYRFETSAKTLSGRTVATLYREFYDAAYNKPNALPISKVLDGVIHFKVRAFDTNGWWIDEDRDVSASGAQNNTDIRYSTTVAPGEIDRYCFFSNAVPAAMELELGILEDKAWQRFQGLPTGAAQASYLSNQVGRVHIFRQRMQIRNVDPAAYQ